MKIRWSGLGVTNGSGKIGGNVAGFNRYGAYLRRKGSTVNPQSIAQQAVRMAFGAFSQAWRALTSEQQAAWRALTAFVTLTDWDGTPYSPTGAQLYISTNQNLSRTQNSAISDAYVPIGAAQLEPAVVVMDVGAGATQAITINMANSVLLVGQISSVIIEATPPVSAGRSFGSIKNLFRAVGYGANLPNVVLPTADGTPIALTSAAPFGSATLSENYATVFGIPAAGQKVFWRFRAVNDTTGESSPIIMAESIVIATP